MCSLLKFSFYFYNDLLDNKYDYFQGLLSVSFI